MTSGESLGHRLLSIRQDVHPFNHDGDVSTLTWVSPCTDALRGWSNPILVRSHQKAWSHNSGSDGAHQFVEIIRARNAENLTLSQLMPFVQLNDKRRVQHGWLCE